jgi:16S rRNA (uracil1498-N3)-methyltransferase
MSERRLFEPRLGAPGERVELSADAARHARVLRLGAGDRVILFDGTGAEAEATIEGAHGDRVACVIVARREAGPRVLPRVVLVQALPKGGKIDEIVRASTEAGAAALHLALSERSVARPDPARVPGRLERLARIAREAARQCGRPDVPELVPPAPLIEVARRAPSSAARLVLFPRAGARWDQVLADADEAWIALGPEGGWAPAEQEALAGLGWRAARIEVPVLRVEHAAPIAVAMLVDRLRARR